MRHTATRHISRQILTLALLLAAGHTYAQPAPLSSFAYQNPLDFSYPYYDGTRERKITELRDPAIIREGGTYYLTFTVFPFTHSDSRKADKPDANSPPGIMLYSSPDLKDWKFEKWLVKSSSAATSPSLPGRMEKSGSPTAVSPAARPRADCALIPSSSMKMERLSHLSLRTEWSAIHCKIQS